jgi:hypothetical protein
VTGVRGDGRHASARARLGTLLLDHPFLAWPLVMPGLTRARDRWTEFHNRHECLVAGPERGFDCKWEWTSDLNVAKTLPGAGGKLMRAALAHWPIRAAGASTPGATGDPVVSFILGHRGADRMPHLLATLSTILAQDDCPMECLVVEQSSAPELDGHLPTGVRHLPLRPPVPDMPYSRAWAFNVGAREARGRILVFHDNDVLVPARYATELRRLVGQGFEGARLQRFVFYLSRHETEPILRGAGRLDHTTPEVVRQNCEGHSVALTRDAYFRIGGHDEGFVGWGGEDNEFFDRCRTLRFHPWAYLPFVHLWHAPQATRERPAGALEYLARVRRLPVESRIHMLASKPFGSVVGPQPGLMAP